MSPFRYREEPPYIYAEEEESTSRSALYIAIGAAAGFAAGVLMAERLGGFKGLTDRIRDTFGGGDWIESQHGGRARTECHWEGQLVGTGRRRQGNSSEVDRHADPHTVLEERSMSTDRAFMSQGDDNWERAQA